MVTALVLPRYTETAEGIQHTTRRGHSEVARLRRACESVVSGPCKHLTNAAGKQEEK